MASYTSRFNLTKPAQTDNYDVGVFNRNADAIDQYAAKRPTSGTNGNIAVLNGDKDYTDGGKRINQLVDKVSNPTAGNFASLTSGGGIADSGFKASDFATADAFDRFVDRLNRQTLSAQVTFYPPSSAASTPHQAGTPSDNWVSGPAGSEFSCVTKTVSWTKVNGLAKDNTNYAVTWTTSAAANGVWREGSRGHEAFFVVDIMEKTTDTVTIRLSCRTAVFGGELTGPSGITFNLHAIGGVSF